MEKHIFDTGNRIPASEAAQLDTRNWAPPTINEAGHLIYAEPRDTGKRDMTNLESAQAGASSAQNELETSRQQGLKLGREEGFAQGKAEGLEAGKQEGSKLGQEAAAAKAKQVLDEKLGELNQLLTCVSHSLNEEDYKLEQAMLNLVQVIAEAVVKKELVTDPGQLMKIIKEVIASLPPNRDNVKIRLNPKDKAIVDGAINLGGENWHAVADEEVSQGGCIVQTDQSIVDFTTEVRFKSAVEQIVEGHLHCPTVADADFEEADEPLVTKAHEEDEAGEPDFEAQAKALESGQVAVETEATPQSEDKAAVQTSAAAEPAREVENTENASDNAATSE